MRAGSGLTLSAKWAPPVSEGLQAKVDFDAWDSALTNLGGPIKVDLARSMAVAGGTVIRDEAKQYAPVKDGVLRDAIYLAYRGAYSNDKQVTYSISWNAKKAPHGHLIEFGHWQPFVTIKRSDGSWITTDARLKDPKWVPAHPFLRPALDGGAGPAFAAMVRRGRARLPELLAEYSR